MYKFRKNAKVDLNQNEIVEELRKLPDISVEVGHDDILVGYEGNTYWYELKSEEAVSKKTGEVLPSSLKDSQKVLLETYKGHYKIVWKLDHILADIKYKRQYMGKTDNNEQKLTIVDILRKFLVGKTIRLTRTYNNNNKKPFKVKSVEPQHEYDWFGYKVFISSNKFIDDLEIDEEFFILDDN